MDKYKYDESNSLWYELNGGYYFPCPTMPESESKPIGLWGRGTGATCISTGKSSTRNC